MNSENDLQLLDRIRHLAEALDDASAQTTAQLPSAPSVPERLTSRYAILMAAAVLAVVVGATGLLLLQREAGERPVNTIGQPIATFTPKPTPPPTLQPTASPGAPATPDPRFEMMAPEVGQPMGQLIIPSIEVRLLVVEGVGSEQLRDGPGHYSSTALPGTLGNVGIAGHRTVYGAPFYRLDELAAGDQIWVRSTLGLFEYRVINQDNGTAQLIVDLDDLAVLDPTQTGLLTLTTQHPAYANTRRLIVQADLVDEPVEAPWPTKVEPVSEFGPAG